MPSTCEGDEAFRCDETILGQPDGEKVVEFEADVIFTAAFIGIAMTMNDKSGGLAWRVDMEPNTDEYTDAKGKKTQAGRTADDREAMKLLNDVCSKINQVIRNHTGKTQGGISWGLTPLFERGGMICGGPEAKKAYGAIQENDARKQRDDRQKETYAQTAFKYLTVGKDDAGRQDMYIGRGAYCGIVLDGTGSAIDAMSTIRTTLTAETVGVGKRWVPPSGAKARKKQYPDAWASMAWGLIGGPTTAALLLQQGMRYCPTIPDPPYHQEPNTATDTVAYVHGMVRSIYEVVRLRGHEKGHGPFSPFEMSIGTDTFKLASCLSCSGFMIANGFDPSASHLGRGESWGPYYTRYETYAPPPPGQSRIGSGSHNWSFVATEAEAPLSAAITTCNAAYAKAMHVWITNGIAVLKDALTGTKAFPKKGWVAEDHRPALAALATYMERSTPDNTVARDLYLDAMTVFKADAKRINDTLIYGENVRQYCDGTYDWCQNFQPDGTTTKPVWITWENRFTDEYVTKLHAPVTLDTTKS